MFKFIFFTIFFSIISYCAKTQDYEEFDTLSRNDFVIHTSGGLGFYYLIHNDPNSENKITASTILNLGASYFIAQNISLGFSFSRLTFPSDKDSAQSAKTNLTALSLKIFTSA